MHMIIHCRRTRTRLSAAELLDHLLFMTNTDNNFLFIDDVYERCHDAKFHDFQTKYSSIRVSDATLDKNKDDFWKHLLISGHAARSLFIPPPTEE